MQEKGKLEKKYRGNLKNWRRRSVELAEINRGNLIKIYREIINFWGKLYDETE